MEELPKITLYDTPTASDHIGCQRKPKVHSPFISVVPYDKPKISLSSSVRISEYIEATFPSSGPALRPTETCVFQSVFVSYLADKV